MACARGIDFLGLGGLALECASREMTTGYVRQSETAEGQLHPSIAASATRRESRSVHLVEFVVEDGLEPWEEVAVGIKGDGDRAVAEALTV